VRTNRQVLRLCLLVVIFMAFFGGWYADQRWQAMTGDLEVDLSNDTDWVSLASTLVENSIKFFQGATSSGQGP